MHGCCYQRTKDRLPPPFLLVPYNAHSRDKDPRVSTTPAMNIAVAFCACAFYFATSNSPILTGGTPGLRKSAGWMTAISITLVALDLFPAVIGYLGYLGERVWHSLFKAPWGDLITIATYGGFTYFLAAIWRIHGEKRLSIELRPRGTRSDNARLVSYQTRLRGEMAALGERDRLAA